MKTQLRPYQQEAREAILHEWDNGHRRTLLVLPTGTGKTIVFSAVTEDMVRKGERVLILAHRGELLDQASDKLLKSTGLRCSIEKAEETCLGTWERVTVGSVQSFMRPARLERFREDYFGSIIVDEAHHALSEGYQRVLEHFPRAKILGVTATPDRGDMRDLGQYFDSLAYEYTLPQAIREGYLCPIRAMTIPLKLDLTGVAVRNGDFRAEEVGSALDPYLEQIATEMERTCKDRKTVVFLPLIKTSQKFCEILREHGFRAAEVNGQSEDRKEILEAFDAGQYEVLCNSMLLTEGWDCPSVDCIIVLRPTKIRSLYCQMVGRGTRLSPGKDHLLLLDFLWLTERHELCRPACLIAEDPDVAQQMTVNLSGATNTAVDIVEAENQAASDVVAQREEALAKQLYEMRRRKRGLVDPLQFEMSIQAPDLTAYKPAFGWEAEAIRNSQKEELEHYGISPEFVETAGKAQQLLDKLFERKINGYSTPKQIRFLEKRGFKNVGQWSFNAAKNMIDRIAANDWRLPRGVNPATYTPKGESNEHIQSLDFIWP